MRPIQHDTVVINGIRMHYAKAGSGPLLLLLHGFPEYWYSWHYQIEAFCTHYTVVAPDLRGYNDTDKPTWGYEVDVLVSDVVELIHALGYARATIVGHDWGGMLGWLVAWRYAHRVERLVVVNTPHPNMLADFRPSGLPMRLPLHVLLPLPGVPEIVLRANDYALVEQVLCGTAPCKHALCQEEVEQYKDAISKPGALTAALNWYRSGPCVGTFPHCYPVGHLLKGKPLCIEVPTLLLWSAENHSANVSLLDNTDKYVAHAHTRIITDCAYRLLQEQPERVSRALAEFLAQ